MTLDMLTIAAIWEIENRTERILLIDEPDATSIQISRHALLTSLSAGRPIPDLLT